MKRKTLWNWLTQFANSYAIATILVVVVSLSFNGFDKAIVILEHNTLIRRLEIVGGIISFIVLLINYFSKWMEMAEDD